MKSGEQEVERGTQEVEQAETVLRLVNVEIHLLPIATATLG